jgi:branched-chain amino acid transport system ATP-binding protein
VTTVPRLAVRDLQVVHGYGGYGTAAVSGYAVELARGTVTVLLGRNGAGKTSTLRGIVGFLSHEPAIVSGEVRVDGVAVRRRDPLRSARRGVGLVLERGKVFPNLTVGEQLRLVAPGAGAVEPAFERFPVLRGRTGVRAGLLSGGERQMLATALVLLTRPKVLLVDELSLGLAPVVVKRLVPTLAEVAESGVGVLLIEQFAHVALSLANSAYVLEGGHIRYHGTASELREKPELLSSAYLLREQADVAPPPGAE